MTREEAILAMLYGEQVTSDEFNAPDKDFCIYNKNMEQPFRFISEYGDGHLDKYWQCKTWRLRKYIPKDKELAWSWDAGDEAAAALKYYDAENNATFSYKGERGGKSFTNYAQFNGTPPPNICKPEELED